MKGCTALFIEINDIKKSYGSGESKIEVLKGINIGIEKGEFCVLLGPSGSGKSTLLNIIGGIDDADSGYISINGEKTENMNEKALTEYRRKHLGYIFQMYNLIPNLNIKENIETGAYLSDHPLDVDEILKTLGLYEHRHKLPSQLSGGQQQRCSIGRAIVKTRYPPLRRAYRCAGLSYIKGNIKAYRNRKSEIQHHDNHGNSQRSYQG